MNLEDYARDLVPFADLGATPPILISGGDKWVVEITRNGASLRLTFSTSDGSILVRGPNEFERKYSSFKSLLASETFCDLRRWADTQVHLLAQSIDPDSSLPVKGILSTHAGEFGVEDIDLHLAREDNHSAINAWILLINGPAGIGKTHFIESLAFRRAQHFKTTGAPLILHVQSRGRNLSFIQDLMAFSLQSLRLTVTYDQVPVLVRHKLVSLAIDGFDELGDPNGYDLAWAQVNDLIGQTKGGAPLLLAGRETFLGGERLFHDVKVLNSATDSVETLSLLPPAPNTAKAWLRNHGWNQGDIDNYEELFEADSYALRPFFLRKLGDPELAEALRINRSGYPISLLVGAMIEREAAKFGRAVEAVMDKPSRISFVRRLLGEAARDMADNQTEAIDETVLGWTVDLVLGGSMPAEVTSLLRNRVTVMAFLTLDERPGFRRFSHSLLLSYFLAEVTVEAVRHGEIPKYLRRNILGPDFLSVFGDVLSSIAGSRPSEAKEFVTSAAALMHNYRVSDRGARNLGAILLAAMRLAELVDGLKLIGLSVDDAVVQETSGAVEVSRGAINQIDIRGADLGKVRFTDSTIVTVIANAGTRTSPSFPMPAMIQFETASGGLELLYDIDAIRKRIDLGWRPTALPESEEALPPAYETNSLVRILDRACRFGEYWIRSEGDEFAEKIVNHERWNDVVKLLDQHDLVRMEERRPASGRQSTFFHIRRKAEILSRSIDDKQLSDFFASLRNAVRQDA